MAAATPNISKPIPCEFDQLVIRATNAPTKLRKFLIKQAVLLKLLSVALVFNLQCNKLLQAPMIVMPVMQFLQESFFSFA